MAELKKGPQGLPICDKCGWQMTSEDEHRRYPVRCDVKAGRFAKELVKASPVPATMHGYGTGRLTFKFGRNQSLTFDLNRSVGKINHLHWLKDMKAGEILEFVKALEKIVNR